MHDTEYDVYGGYLIGYALTKSGQTEELAALVMAGAIDGYNERAYAILVGHHDALTGGYPRSESTWAQERI